MTERCRVKACSGVRVRPLLVMLGLTVCLNIALCVYFAIQAHDNQKGASNYLLYMFMLNMFVYLTYYIIMKLVNGERPVKIAWFYLCKLYYIAC